MKIIIFFLWAFLIGLGLYFHLLTIDPAALALTILILINCYSLGNRQQQTVDALSKSHSVLATNQKEILRKIDLIRAEVKKKV